MTAKLLEGIDNNENYRIFECTPNGSEDLSEIRISLDLIGVVGEETILKHIGSNSLGFFCSDLDSLTRNCKLNNQPCEQVPGAN